MKALVRKIQLSLLLFFGILFLFSSLVVYRPLHQEIRQGLEENFVLNARSRGLTLHQIIDSYLDHAHSISSSSITRREILRYFSGQIERVRLAEYTRPLYRDSLIALDEIGYAARIVDREVLVEFGSLTPFDSFTEHAPPQRSFRLEEHPEGWVLVVHSPIFEGNRILGHDVLTVDLTAPLAQLTDQNMSCEIVPVSDLDEAATQLRATSVRSGGLQESGDLVYWSIALDDGVHALRFHTEKERLYQPLQRLTRVNLLTLAAIFALLWLFISFFVGLHAQKLFGYLEKTIQRQQEALQEASFDDMTGALNRSQGLRQLEKSRQTARHRKWNLSICFVDINGLKDVNDHLGHAKGDELLQTIGQVVCQQVREFDYLVRMGGDEFLIVLPQAGKEEAEAVWQRILRLFGQINEQEKRPYRISVSHGIVAIEPDEPHPVDHWIRLADQTMYAEKEKTRLDQNVLRSP